MQNAFIESFNGRPRDELLNETLFTSLAQTRIALGCWRADYNDDRLGRNYSDVRDTIQEFAALSFGRSSTTYRLEPTGDLSDQGRSSGSGSRLSKLERTTCGERGMMAPSPLAGAFSFDINRELRADGLLDD
jgi:hypothetical protein